VIPLAVPNLNGNEARYLQDCIESNFVSSIGPFVDQLEHHVSTATESRSAVATSSGTAGLHVALTAVGVRQGDLVVIPTFTFIATANAVAQCGADPWLMDIDEHSWTLDPSLLGRQLQEHCRRTREGVFHRSTDRRVSAIIAVYTFGNTADMDRINALAAEWRLPVLADAAAAIGARYRNRNLGGLACLSVASFNGNKTVTCGGGGAVFSNDTELLARVRHLSTTARVGSAYDHDLIGFNYRMTNLQAAVGCAQFERLNEFLARKREVYVSYSRLAAELDDCTPFTTPGWGQSAHWLSGIVLPSYISLSRGLERLRGAGVEVRPFWKPIHLQTPYVSSPRSDTAVSDALWDRVLVLPSSTSISDQELARVNEAVLDWIRNRTLG